MIDDHLRNELTRIGDRLVVGAAPTAEILAAARATRRRRQLLAGIAGIAVVAAAAVAASWAGGAVEQPQVVGAPSTVPSSTAAEPSPAPQRKDQRLVGVGRAQIAVPMEWGTNELRCGIPQRDTVIIDLGTIGWCATTRPENVDSVELAEGKPRLGFAADDTITIDGVPAERQRTTCTRRLAKPAGLCVGALYLPSLNASFRAESSDSAAAVDRILGLIEVSADRVAVPGFRSTEAEPPEQDGNLYAIKLNAAGLTPTIVTKRSPGLPAGYILAVHPAAGTMLPAGADVTVTVVAAPSGPAEELAIGVGIRSGATYRFLTDRELRAGADTTLNVGDEIWAFADGRRSDTLAGALDGSGLSVTTWQDSPNYPHHWVATGPGRTTLALRITADQDTIALGTVTITIE